jgi:hypothetical protein
MDEDSGDFLDSIGSADITPTGVAPTYAQPSIDVEALAAEYNDTYNTAVPVSVATQVVTVAALVRVDSTANAQFVFGFGDAHATNGLNLFYSNTLSAIGFNMFNAGDVYGSVSADFVDGNWHTVIAEFNGTTVYDSRIWVDNQELTLTQLFGATNNRAINPNFTIGGCANYTPANNFWQGGISRVTIFDKALNTNERYGLHWRQLG